MRTSVIPKNFQDTMGDPFSACSMRPPLPVRRGSQTHPRSIDFSRSVEEREGHVLHPALRGAGRPMPDVDVDGDALPPGRRLRKPRQRPADRLGVAEDRDGRGVRHSQDLRRQLATVLRSTLTPTFPHPRPTPFPVRFRAPMSAPSVPAFFPHVPSRKKTPCGETPECHRMNIFSNGG